jgi:hypothetical protein
VKELCPNSKVLEGFSIKGGVERDGSFSRWKVKKKRKHDLRLKNGYEKSTFLNRTGKGIQP